MVWHTRQVDYVLAYPQAPVERELYMKVPMGFEVPVGKAEDYLLKIHKNIYGQKQAGRVWYEYLRKRLESIGFKCSKEDDCVFFKGKAMYVLYTDDSILAGPYPGELDRILEEITSSGLEITSEGGIEDFLGVNIERRDDSTIHLTQPRLIDSILSDLGLLNDNVAV